MRDMEPQRWFAWYPVIVCDRHTDRFWAWMEYVWRRRERDDLIARTFDDINPWGWFHYIERPTNDYWKDGEGFCSGKDFRRK